MQDSVTFKRMIGAAALVGILAVAWMLAGPSSAASDWQVPSSAAAVHNPVPADAASQTRGKATFKQECAGCHGTQGKGDGEDAAKLQKKPADLTASDVAAESDGELFWKITTGRSPMPKFSKRLNDNERWDVVNYVRSLQSER
jgi:mono/diheme cytochrome c family protein